MGKVEGWGEKSRQRNHLLVSSRDQDWWSMPGYWEFEKARNFFREGYSDFVFVFVMYSHSLIHRPLPPLYQCSSRAKPEIKIHCRRLNPKKFDQGNDICLSGWSKSSKAIFKFVIKKLYMGVGMDVHFIASDMI